MKSDDGIARALRARMRMRESCGRKYRYKVPLFLKNEGAASFDERAGSSSDNRAEVIHIAPCSNKRAGCCQPCVTTCPQPPTKGQVAVRFVSRIPVPTKGQLAVSNVTCQQRTTARLGCAPLASAAPALLMRSFAWPMLLSEIARPDSIPVMPQPC